MDYIEGNYPDLFERLFPVVQHSNIPDQRLFENEIARKSLVSQTPSKAWEYIAEELDAINSADSRGDLFDQWFYDALIIEQFVSINNILKYFKEANRYLGSAIKTRQVLIEDGTYGSSA